MLLHIYDLKCCMIVDNCKAFRLFKHTDEMEQSVQHQLLKLELMR